LGDIETKSRSQTNGARRDRVHVAQNLVATLEARALSGFHLVIVPSWNRYSENIVRIFSTLAKNILADE
jgi:hypothetical protein